MRQINLSLLVAAVSAAAPAVATEFTDYAEVISATPIREIVITPRNRCETVRAAPEARGERSLAGPIIGGLAGGVLGSQLGKGNGKTAGAVVGAITGAVVGDRLDNDEPTRRAQPRQRCWQEETREDRIRGYEVVYEYGGRQYATEMCQDPGASLRLVVKLIPAE